MSLAALRPAAALLMALTLLTGLAYPLGMAGLARGIAPASAEGSLILREGRAIGSALIGQAFRSAGYLHPRPSARDYAALPSGASNLGPTSAALQQAVAARRAEWRAENGGPASREAVPMDAVTTSASGLDPHVSPENARGQAARIAAARGLPLAEVLARIADATEGPWLGLYGEARVDVLRVNLALDAAAAQGPAAGN